MMELSDVERLSTKYLAVLIQSTRVTQTDRQTVGTDRQQTTNAATEIEVCEPNKASRELAGRLCLLHIRHTILRKF